MKFAFAIFFLVAGFAFGMWLAGIVGFCLVLLAVVLAGAMVG